MIDPIDLASDALARGEIVAAATESFFGLHVDALRPEAVTALFALKGRRPTEPVPVLIADLAAVDALVEVVPEPARALMARHWPGPLTIVLRARPEVPALLCGGTGKIGLRIPGPCPAAELLRRSGRPITATSANRSGETPLTRSDDVESAFGSAVAVVVPGRAPGGSPSTVIDVTQEPFRLVRAGAVPLEGY